MSRFLDKKEGYFQVKNCKLKEKCLKLISIGKRSLVRLACERDVLTPPEARKDILQTATTNF